MREPTSVLVVIPPVEIDAATVPEFAERVQRQLEQFPDLLVIDFADVTYVGVGAIDVLRYTQDVVDRYGGTLRIRHATRSLRRLLELSPNFADAPHLIDDTTITGD